MPATDEQGKGWAGCGCYGGRNKHAREDIAALSVCTVPSTACTFRVYEFRVYGLGVYGLGLGVQGF